MKIGNWDFDCELSINLDTGECKLPATRVNIDKLLSDLDEVERELLWFVKATTSKARREIHWSSYHYER